MLDGHTGTAKTDILARLALLGVQTVDLEELAGHRGSLFGAIPGRCQPSQKAFESRLLAVIESLDPAAPVLIEGESSKIGERLAPPALLRAMATAPRITIHAAPVERARYLVEAYGDRLEDVAALEAIIGSLPRHHSKEQRKAWRDLARTGAFEALASGLIEAHYDPAYERSTSRGERRVLGSIDAADLTPAGRQRSAEAIARLLEEGVLAQ